MTSTPFNVGLGDGKRLSSRVLRPPGGGHTDIFGGEPEPPRGRRPAPSVAKVPEESISPIENTKAANGTESLNENGHSIPKPEEQPTPTPTLQPIEPVKMDVAAKPENPVVEPSKVEPPKRVRVPPGGFSSGLW